MGEVRSLYFNVSACTSIPHLLSLLFLSLSQPSPSSSTSCYLCFCSSSFPSLHSFPHLPHSLHGLSSHQIYRQSHPSHLAFYETSPSCMPSLVRSSDSSWLCTSLHFKPSSSQRPSHSGTLWDSYVWHPQCCGWMN